jgi:hypothetical protein
MKHPKIGLFILMVAAVAGLVISAQSSLFAAISLTPGNNHTGTPRCTVRDRQYGYVNNCRQAFLPYHGGMNCKTTQDGDLDAVTRINNFGGTTSTGPLVRTAVGCIVAYGGHNLHDCAPANCNVVSGDIFTDRNGDGPFTS